MLSNFANCLHRFSVGQFREFLHNGIAYGEWANIVFQTCDGLSECFFVCFAQIKSGKIGRVAARLDEGPLLKLQFRYNFIIRLEFEIILFDLFRSVIHDAYGGRFFDHNCEARISAVVYDAVPSTSEHRILR